MAHMPGVYQSLSIKLIRPTARCNIRLAWCEYNIEENGIAVRKVIILHQNNGTASLSCYCNRLHNRTAVDYAYLTLHAASRQPEALSLLKLST